MAPLSQALLRPLLSFSLLHVMHCVIAALSSEQEAFTSIPPAWARGRCQDRGWVPATPELSVRALLSGLSSFLLLGVAVPVMR